MTSTDDCRQQEQSDQAPVVEMKPQMKKQARRRTHASRPYQERLLNMAEARREIVTALKIHRASMRQQQPPCNQHQADTLLLRHQPPPPLQQQQHQEEQQQVVFQDDPSQAVPAAPMSYISFADHQLAHPVAAAALDPYDLTQLEAPMPTTMSGYGLGCQHGLGLEQLAHGLPAQPLGLNLSFQGLVDGPYKGCEDLYGVPVIQSASPAATSSYSATEMGSGGTHGSPALSSSTAEKYSSPADAPAAALIAPPVLDDAEREAQSAGETTQGVEWWGEATTAAEDVSAASAWWSKILLESVESGGGGGEVAAEEDAAVAADGFPAEWRRWLCDDGVGEQGAVITGGDKTPDVLETKQLADGDGEEGGRRSDGGGDGVALPCMDEDDDIQGWDCGEWFSCSS